jgi:hypothetical protein
MSDTPSCTCTNDDAHQGHLCVLDSQGKTAEIAALSDAPTVVCFICGREANNAVNVCSPMPIAQA